MVWLIVILVVVALVLLALVVLYNRFVRLRNRVDNAWAQIEVQLKRRWDLIPNLVETVKGYAEHERGTFEAVTEARANAQRASGPAETAAAEGILGAGARAAVRGRRGLSGAAGGRELPPAAGRARRDGEPDRGLAAGLQRHRADLQQRDPDVPGRRARRPVRVREARVLRDGRDAARGPAGRLLARPPAPTPPPPAPSAPPAEPPARAAPPVGRRRASPSRRPRSPRSASQGSPRRRPTRSSRATSRSRSARTASVAVDEAITVAFSGSFTYGFREIPLPLGRADRRDRRLGERQLVPSRCAPPSSSRAGPPGTFGVETSAAGSASCGGSERTASSSAPSASTTGSAASRSRTTTSSTSTSRSGATNGSSRLGRLTATMRGPGNVVRAWGHPVWVRGDVTIGGRDGDPPGARRRPRTSSSSCGRSIPARRFTSTAGMKVTRGQRARRRSSPKSRPTPPSTSATTSGSTTPSRPVALASSYVLALGTIPALLIAGVVFWRFGREPRDGRTTASTSRSRRPRPQPGARARRCSARAARRARTSSPRRSST